MHESQCHAASSFITLTYDDENLPKDESLEPHAIPNFIRTLRDRLRYQGKKLGAEPPEISYYGCGEYGDMFARPHYHIALFGTDFPDAVELHSMHGGRYSRLIEQLWPNGSHFVGNLTFESAQYVAGYVIKKITGKHAKRHYTVLDPRTGELQEREPEFARMSRNPAIGRRFQERYADSLKQHDSVIARGREMALPRYYDKRLELDDPELMEEIKEKRADKRKPYDSARLAARAIINDSRQKLYRQKQPGK